MLLQTGESQSPLFGLELEPNPQAPYTHQILFWKQNKTKKKPKKKKKPKHAIFCCGFQIVTPGGRSFIRTD